MNKEVYGHALAKKLLINLVNKSKLRYYQKWGMLEDVPKLHNNLLLIGGSGTGKTFLIENLKKLCPFPCFRIDATKLGPTGSSSSINASDITKSMLKYAKQLVEDGDQPSYHSVDGVMDQMILFIDEADKLANAFESSGKWNEQIQSCLLTLMDNTGEFEGLSFIFAGAFSELHKETTSRGTIGFSDQVQDTDKNDDWHKKIIKYGLLPEFVGRINHITKLDKLTQEDYNNILNNYILPLRLEELKMYYGLDFHLSETLKTSIVKETAINALGVRHMTQQLDELIADAEFNYESLTETKALSIIKE